MHCITPILQYAPQLIQTSPNIAKFAMNLQVINIIARTNGVGLDRDVSLVKNILQNSGFDVVVSDYKGVSRWKAIFGTQEKVFKVNIFMERVFPRWTDSAEINILIPNQERFPRRHLRLLKNVDAVFTKSKHAQEAFSKHHERVIFTGFTSENIFEGSVVRKPGSFMHLAGKSSLKGTEAVLRLWGRHPEWPCLTLVQSKKKGSQHMPENVNRLSHYLSKEDLKQVMNEHEVHLCPSLSEGWGHYIAEALSCGACVITTDAAPMNELVTKSRGILVPWYRSVPRHLGMNYWVKEEDLEKEIQALVNGPGEENRSRALKGKTWFEENEQRFQERIVSELRKLFASGGSLN